MDEEKKKQINDAIELMKSLCNGKDCYVDKCPLWFSGEMLNIALIAGQR